MDGLQVMLDRLAFLEAENKELRKRPLPLVFPDFRGVGLSLEDAKKGFINASRRIGKGVVTDVKGT